MNPKYFPLWIGIGLLMAARDGAFAQEAAAPPTAATANPTPAAPVAADATPPAAAQPAAPPAVTAKPTVPPKAPVIPYDQLAYRVSITLGLAPGVGIGDAEAEKMQRQLTALIESRIGLWWQAETKQAPAGEPRSRAMLEALTPRQWNERMEASPYDKRFALTIDRDGTAFQISGVEWDRSSQTTTQIQTKHSYDRRILAGLAADLTFDLFRPLISVEVVNEKSVEMRVRGGEFLPPDPALTPFAKGEFISPYLRFLGKNKELLRVQHVPWTAIEVNLVERGYLQGTIISAFGTPLGKRRRMEMLGMKIKPEWPETRIKVIPRGKPQAPMAGYRVEVLNRLETKDDKVEDRLKLKTDRNGDVVIPADPAHPLRHMVVYSGIAPLARAPLIPGHERQIVLSAPDDAPRLNVEAETELLQSELVDIVAKREVLMARARGAAKKANWEQVAELTKEVTALTTLEQFQARIETIKLPALQVAKKNKDKGQESRINRMCKEIAGMATIHLDPTKVKEFLVEIEEEKKTQ